MPVVSKSPLTLLPVEGYSLMPGGIWGHEGSHCFVISIDRSIVWANWGGGWSDTRTRTKLCETRMYKEWALNCAPAGSSIKVGVRFGVNGVCHTAANRELLISIESACVKKALSNDLVTFFFGKYGMGLNELKTLLRESYNQTMQNYTDSYDALTKVLKKVDDYIDDEIEVWKSVGKKMGMDVDDIMKKPLGGIVYAKNRLQKYINDREDLFQKCLDKKVNENELKKQLKPLIIKHMTDCLDYLVDVNYITALQKATYKTNLNSFLSKFIATINAQANFINAHGRMAENEEEFTAFTGLRLYSETEMFTNDENEVTDE